MKKNHKSDFDAILRLYTCVADSDERRELGWPDYDWTAKFWTISPVNAYVASCIGGVCTNCFNDNGRIHVVFKNHGLFSGKLHVELKSALLNDIYPDGIQVEVTPSSLGVELVDGRGDCGTIADIEVMLPYIKGDPGADGKDGAQGPQGPQGPPGLPGDNGLSAYEQAVRGGYKGSEEDFMAALAAVDEDKLPENIVLCEETNHTLEAIEPNVVTDSLSKTKQALSDDERAQVLINLGSPERQLLIREWNAACQYGRYSFGRYNEETDDFELNGITGIKDAEAIEILAQRHRMALDRDAVGPVAVRTRTTFPIMINFFGKLHSTFTGSSIEVIRVMSCLIVYNGSNPDETPIRIVDTAGFCQYCSRLREVKGVLQVSSDVSAEHFSFGLGRSGSSVLETVWIQGICKNISFISTAVLRPECVAYMVEWAANKTPIIITLHPDVYARIPEETFAMAAEKNITIAA